MLTNKKAIVLIACAIAALGSFLPWVSAQTIFGTFNVAGTDGDGKITIILAVLTGIFCCLGKAVFSILGVITCVLGIGVSLYDIINISDKVSETSEGFTASVGYGIYLCIVGFVVGLFALLFMKSNRIGVEPVTA